MFIGNCFIISKDEAVHDPNNLLFPGNALYIKIVSLDFKIVKERKPLASLYNCERKLKSMGC
jgi:hypothetical protein